MSKFNNSSLDPRQQARFFDDAAETVQWFPARKCSCSDAMDPNRAKPSCKVCLGIGTFYAAPQWVTGIVANISNSKMLLESGIGLPGDLVFSSQMMDDARLADQDIIKLSDWEGGEAYEGELVRRGADDTDKFIYDAIEIQAVTQTNPDLGTIATFLEKTDFTHAANSDSIVWTLSGVRPAIGSIYSVRYRPLFAYIVFIPPAERREKGTNLGQRVILKKRHLTQSKGV